MLLFKHATSLLFSFKRKKTTTLINYGSLATTGDMRKHKDPTELNILKAHPDHLL